MSNQKQLNQRIDNEYNAVSKRILSSKEKLDENSLQCLKELLEIKEKLKPRENIPKRIYLSLLAVSFFVCGVLIYCDVEKMDVEFLLNVSGITFETQKSQQITKEILAKRLEISGNSELTLPRIKQNQYKKIVLEPPINISPTDITNPVILEPLSSSIGTIFDFEMETESRLVLVLSNPVSNSNGNLSTKVALAEEMLVSGAIRGDSGNVNQVFNFGRSKSAYLRPIKNGSLIFFIDIEKSLSDIFIPELAVSSLQFTKEITQIANDKIKTKSISTILTGTYKTEYMTECASLGRGQWMTFDSVNGDISIALKENGNYEVRFYGQVEGMSLRKGDKQSSIMPSYLEWMYKKNEFSLLWGAAIWLFTLLLGGIKWLKD